jgi:anti-sigma factor (TIGR02949 family)
MERPINCGTFCRQLYHFQADELPEYERRLCQDHLDACEPCARRHALEEGFARGLRRCMKRETAPPELLGRVRGALAREAAPARRGNGFRAPWVAALAASVLLALVLLPASSGLPGVGLLSGVVHVEQRAVVVDLVCDRAGLTTDQQRGCRHPDHLNALKLDGGRYWNLSLDRDSSRSLVVDAEMRGHVLMLEGDFYTGIETLKVTGFEDLGLITERSSLALRAIRRDDRLL